MIQYAFMSIYWQVFLFNAKIYSKYKLKSFYFFLKKSLELIFLIVFWSLIIKQGKDFAYIISYFLISDAISELSMGYAFQLGNKIRKMVKHNEFSNYIIKPLSLIPYLYATYLGDRALQNIFSIICLILGIIIGWSNITFLSTLLFLIFVIIAFSIALSLNLLLASLAIGVSYESASVITIPMRYLIRLLSGALVPLIYFPEYLRPILRSLPFSFLVSAPTLALMNQVKFIDVFNQLLLGIGWSIIFIMISIFLFKKSLTKYEATGI